MEKSEKWLADQGGSGNEEFNALWRNWRNALAEQEGSGTEEFDALWRNRGNTMTGSGHWPMFIKTMPCS